MLARLFPDLSRGVARRAIRAGAVFVNDRRCRVAGRLVRPGDRLRLAAVRQAPIPAPLQILYEDDCLIAVDKPAGMPSAPTRTAATGSAQDALARQLRQRDGRSEPLWAVHRLDTETSGVLLFAKRRTAAARLSAAFRDRDVDKRYLALVAGHPATNGDCIALPLRGDGRLARVAPDGKPARTDWQVRRRNDATTLLAVHPHTGRMHQIRVHLQAIGHPVVGDRRYGGPAAARLMLHAERIDFPHPTDGRRIEIRSAPPTPLTT